MLTVFLDVAALEAAGGQRLHAGTHGAQAGLQGGGGRGAGGQWLHACRDPHIPRMPPKVSVKKVGMEAGHPTEESLHSEKNILLSWETRLLLWIRASTSTVGDAPLNGPSRRHPPCPVSGSCCSTSLPAATPTYTYLMYPPPPPVPPL